MALRGQEGGKEGSSREEAFTCKCPQDPGRYIKEELGRMFARD